jgi:hypothetical protein
MRLVRLVIGLVLCTAGSNAQALPFTGTLSITYFDPEIQVSGVGAGASADGPPDSFTLSSADFTVAGLVAAPPADAPAIVGFEVSAGNAAGSLDGTGGSMALSGQLVHYFFEFGPAGAISIPLDTVGVGGSLPFNTTVYGLPASGTITGDVWTTLAISLPGTIGTLSASGFDARSPDGSGAMRLLSPFTVALDIGPNSYPSIPGYAQLDLVFTPEPGTLALGNAAVAAIAAIAAQRRRS